MGPLSLIKGHLEGQQRIVRGKSQVAQYHEDMLVLVLRVVTIIKKEQEELKSELKIWWD